MGIYGVLTIMIQLTLALLALVLVARSWPGSRPEGIGRRVALAVAVGLLLVGSVAQITSTWNAETGNPWDWALAPLLASTAVLALLDPWQASRFTFAVAAVLVISAPVAALISSALGQEWTAGDGRPIPLGEQLAGVLIGSIMIAVVFALVGLLLRYTGRPAPSMTNRAVDA